MMTKGEPAINNGETNGSEADCDIIHEVLSRDEQNNELSITNGTCVDSAEASEGPCPPPPPPVFFPKSKRSTKAYRNFFRGR